MRGGVDTLARTILRIYLNVDKEERVADCTVKEGVISVGGEVASRTEVKVKRKRLENSMAAGKNVRMRLFEI